MYYLGSTHGSCSWFTDVYAPSILGNHPIASVESAPAVTMALAFSTLARAGRAGHGHAKLGFLNQTSHLQVNSLDSLSMMGVCVHIIYVYIHRIVR